MIWGFIRVVARLTKSFLFIGRWDFLGLGCATVMFICCQLLGFWIVNIFLALKNTAAINIFVAVPEVLNLHRVPEPRGQLVKTQIARPHPHNV